MNSETSKIYIPAKEKADIYAAEHVFRTCAYCRVSTDSEMQMSSMEFQRMHYENLARDHPNWDLKKVYADEGISGTSLKKRDQFNEMLGACLRGEYDLIVTKSVSRFARNTLDCIRLVRELKGHNPPIGVFFETDNLFTLAEDSELKLTILATLAQEESVKKSESMVWSLEHRLKNGRLLIPECYGYRREKDPSGRYVKDARLEIVEEEARVVRFIFDAFLAGFPLTSIAEILSETGIPTKTGQGTWNEGSLHYILTNERYCGNVLTWKTFTADIFEHKKRKNRQDRDQYLYENYHEPIVSAETFEAVQSLLANKKYGVKAAPKMYVIEDGIFRGFVPVNHHWMNEDPSSYYEASNSAPQRIRPKSVQRAKFSSFDLRGYQVVRGVFLSYRAECPTITVTEKTISFNTVCQKKFREVGYIQLLIHPAERKIAIRPCRKDAPHSIRWRSAPEQPYGAKGICCPYFSSTLYQIMDWNPDYHYRIRGIWAAQGTEQIIMFDTDNAQPMLLIRKKRENGKSSARSVGLMPEQWEEEFGEEFYEHSVHNALAGGDDAGTGRWDSGAEGHAIPGQIRTKSENELLQMLNDKC